MESNLIPSDYVYPGAKNAAMRVLAGLIENPLLFSDSHYDLDIGDFPEQFQKIVFGAVDHLAKAGYASIDWTKIDSFLKNYPVQYRVFCDNRGIEYIQNAISLSKKDDFEASYEELKKYRLLNDLTKSGIAVDDIYSDQIDPLAHEAMQKKFDALDVKQILTMEEEKLIKIKSDFVSKSALTECAMGDGVMDLIKKDFEAPVMGLPFSSPKMTTLYFGFRKGAYYVTSASSGVGKTRQMVGESCHFAYPEYYDLQKKEWVNTGLANKTVFISTELDHDEQTRMCLAYLSGVEQFRVATLKCTAEEKKRWEQAGRVMEKYKDNLIFIPMSTFTGDDIKTVVEKYHQIYHVDYYFFDYLMSNEDMLEEGGKRMRVSNVREDMLLLNVSTTLKTLCKELQVAIWTATQVTLPQDSSQQMLLDEHCVRGAKSIPDKADVGAVFSRVRGVDKPAIDVWYSKHPEFKGNPDKEPNAVLHFYKTRIGPFYGTKLYIHFDLGTCRVTDCFATDKEGNLITVEGTEVRIKPVDESKQDADPKQTSALSEDVVDDPLPESLDVPIPNTAVGASGQKPKDMAVSPDGEINFDF